MNVIERIGAADAAVRETYGTPAGGALVLAARFGLPISAISPLQIAEMWRRLVAERAAKLRAKLGLDVEDQLVAVPLEPSPRLIAEGLRFMRCAPADMPKTCAAMRDAAWAGGWETRCTRWVGMMPTRRKKGDPWAWHRERRTALWLERDGVRIVAHWVGSGFESGWMWAAGGLRTRTGYRDLVNAVKVPCDR